MSLCVTVLFTFICRLLVFIATGVSDFLKVVKEFNCLEMYSFVYFLMYLNSNNHTGLEMLKNRFKSSVCNMRMHTITAKR